MGAPLCVLEPLRAQLLLPLAGLGFSISCNVPAALLLWRYKESEVAGAAGLTVGGGKMVPFGTTGSSESATAGKRIRNASSPKNALAFVNGRSSEWPDK